MRRLLLVLGLLCTAVAGCGGVRDPGTPDGPRVRVVGQNFTEADVLTQLYAALLSRAGFDVSIEKIGARDLYLGPLGKGRVQVAADTLSATLEALNHRANGADASAVAVADPARTSDLLDGFADDAGITALAPTRASLATVYAVTRTFARAHHLRSLGDLGRSGVRVTLGGGPDCAERPDCAPGLQGRYGIAVARVVPLGAGTPDVETALTAGRIQVAQVASTDPLLDSAGVVALVDDRHLVNPENVVPLVNSDWLADHPQARKALEQLGSVLTTADLRRLTRQVNVAHLSARRAARDYLGSRDLL